MSVVPSGVWSAPNRSDRVPWPARGAAQPQSLARPLAPVRLQSGAFLGAGDPAANLALDQSVHLRPGRVHVIVQFDRIPDSALRDRLTAAGVTLLDYLPERAFFASVPTGVRGSELAAAGIHWLGAIDTADKLSPRVNAGEVGAWARHADGTADLRVKAFADVALADARPTLEALGAVVREPEAGPGGLTINLATARIRDVARLDWVRWIEEVPPPAQELVDNVRTNTQAELVQEPPYNLSGSGVSVGVWDIGLVDNTHADFAGRIRIMDTNSPMGILPHATHVAGIVGGSGSLSVSKGGYPFQWRGLAPGIQILSWDNLNEIAEYNPAINSLGVTISQNSWGVTIGSFYGNCSLFGNYSYDAPAYDGVVNGSLYGGRMNVVFAAGNARGGTSTNCSLGPYATIGPPATAKNTIAVGAINSDDNSMTYFSSWGPVDDGRLKPDLVAPGARLSGEMGVTSTLPGNTYGVLSGTSMAAPAVSGAIALLTEDYHRLFNGVDPMPAAVKALLLHTAEDLNDGSVWLTPGPDYASGYGRLQVKAAVDQLRAGGLAVGQISNGATNFYALPVPADATQVKITLAWDDAPGAENATVALVNDLDLVVFDPQGQRRYVWTLDPAHPQNPATRDREDHLNVVEQVQVDARDIVPGNWTVQVVGHQVPVGPQQSYALAFSPATMSVPPDLAFGQAVPDDTAGGNGNGTIDPGETIYETIPLRNQDGPSATGVQATLLSLTPGVVVLQGVAAYPDIPPGTTASNLTSFVYRVPKSASCGSILNFQQIVTLTNGFAFTNFFAHMVGLFGTTNLTTNFFSNSDGPIPIPDLGLMTSSIPVTVSGQAQNVKVSVRIGHPADEDLAIRLVSPDGTGVVLVANSLWNAVQGQGPSGMGTGACDGTGNPTVFDDAALTAISDGLAPYAGSYRPDAPLSSLVGHPVAGPWQLVVADTLFGDTGSLQCWGLEIACQQQGYTCSLFNRPPVAQPANVTVTHDFPAPVQLVGTDPDDDPLTFALATAPTNGVITGFDPVSGTLTYHPTPGYTGPDSFTFTVNDGLTNSAPAQVSLNVAPPRAELSLSVSAPDRVALGSNLVVALTLTNAGPNPATDVVLTDLLPAGADFVSAQTSQGGFTNGATGLVFALGGLAAGAAAQVEVVLRPTVIGGMTNSVAATAAELDSDAGDNVATTITWVNQSADLAVASVAPVAQVLLGGSFTLQFLVTNQGPSQATGVSLVDNLPSGVQVISVASGNGSFTLTNNVVTFDLGSLDAGAAAAVAITLQPTAIGLLTNLAVAAANEFDFAPGDNAVTNVVAVVPAANLAVSLSAAPLPAALGGDLTYTLAVTNGGPSLATGIMLTNVLPAGVTLVSAAPALTNWAQNNGVLTLPIPDLPPGAGTVVQLGVQPGTLDALTNLATVGANETDPDASDNTAVLVLPVQPVANLAVTLPTLNQSVVVDFPLSWTFTVTNRGPTNASAVVFSDGLPASFTFVSSVIGNGGTGSVQNGTFVAELGGLPAGTNVTVTLTVQPTQLGRFTNIVSVAAAELNLLPADATITNVTVFGTAADLALSVQTTPGPVILGGPLTLNLTVTNSGPDAATGVVVQDQLPSGFTVVFVTTSQGTNELLAGTVTLNLGDLPAGGFATAVIQGSVAVAGAIQNMASVSSDEVDPNPADNQVLTDLMVQLEAELAVQSTVSASPIHFGDFVAIEFAVTNAGPHPASSVTLTDPLPAGLNFVSATASQGTFTTTNGMVVFNLGALANQGSAAVTLVVQPLQLGTITNAAVLNAPEVDTNALDNSATQVLSVWPRADLELLGTVDLPVVAIGTNFTMTFTVTNAGPNAASGVQLTGNVPGGMNLVSLTAASGVVTLGNSGFTVDLGGLAPGATSLVQLVASSPALGTLLLTGQVAAAEFDADLGDNVVVLGVRVLPQADLGVTKSIVSSVPPEGVLLGQTVTYSMSVTNGGPATAANVSIADPLPSGLGFVSAQTSQGSLTNDQGVIRFNVGDLASGAGATVVLVATPQTSGSLTNTALVSGDVIDGFPDNDTATAILTVRPTADLIVIQDVSPNPAALDEPLTLLLTVTNAGPGVATAVQLTDTLSGAFTLLGVTNSQGSVTTNASGVTCQLGDLPVGATATVQLQVRPDAVGLIGNTASVAANEADPDLSNNLTSTIVAVELEADLAVGISATPLLLPLDGRTTFTITVTNLGPAPAHSVVLTDALPAMLTLVTNSASQGSVVLTNGVVIAQLGGLDVGAVATVSLVVSAVDVGLNTNVVGVTAAEVDLQLADNTAAVVTEARYEAELTLSVAAAPGTVLVGDSISWQLVVTNAGPHDATAVTLAVAQANGVELAANLPGVTVSTNQSGALCLDLGPLLAGTNVAVVVTGQAIAPGTSTNVFTVTANELDLSPADNTATTVTVVQPVADLGLSIQLPTEAIVVGHPFTLSLTVTNQGPNAASDVLLTNTLPAAVSLLGAQVSAGTNWAEGNLAVCDFGPLPPGGSALATLSLLPLQLGLITNVATVVAPEADPNLTNNLDAVTATVLDEANLGITLAVPAAPQPLGGVFAYTLTLTNQGPGTATLVCVTNMLPNGLQMVGSTPSDGTVQSVSNTVVWQLAQLVAGTNATLTVEASANLLGSLTNLASVSAAETDLSTNDNAAAAVIRIWPSADLALVTTASQITYLGGSPMYYFQVVNQGPADAPNVVVTQALPAGLTNVAAQVTQGAYTISSNLLVWQAGTVPASGFAEIDISAGILTLGPITNLATVSADVVDTNLANNSAATILNVVPEATLQVSQTASTNRVLVNDQFTCTITVTNLGQVAAPKTVLLAAFSLNADLLGASTTLGTADVEPPGVLCGLGNFAPGASAVITILVHAPMVGEIVCQTTVLSPATDPSDPRLGARLTTEVVATPILWVNRSGGYLMFSWPAVGSNFVLESTTNLANPVWVKVKYPEVISGDVITVTVKATGAESYYRLHQP